MGTSWAAAVGVTSRRGCSFWARRFELERTTASRARDNWCGAIVEAGSKCSGGRTHGRRLKLTST